jgi:predicted O-methyltransferase YrrM
MGSTLLTPSRRFLPLESLVRRREFRYTRAETRGMRYFPVQAATLLGVPREEMARFCSEALGYDVVRRRAGELGTPVEERQLAYGESLYAIVRAARPRLAVETGVCTGITTGYLLAALRRNGDGGRLVSIDLPIYQDEGMVNSDGIRDRSHVAGPEQIGHLADPTLRADASLWSLRLGDAKVLLPQVLEELGSIDLFYHDSEHSYEHMSFEFRAAWPRLRPGGLLISDDIRFSEGARRAWSEFIGGTPGTPWTYFTGSGNRGVLRKPLTG